MPVLPFGEWLPDQPDFDNPGAATIQNVVPLTKQSYGPMPTPVAYSGALTARCQGSYSFVDASGNAHVFAGDATKLYELKAGSTAFGDVSRAVGGAYATAVWPDGFWTLTSYGERIIATNYLDDVQTLLIGTDTKFSKLSAGAPKARYCAVIRDFLMLANTVDGTSGTQPRRAWWSAIGDPTSWQTPGSNAAQAVQSDYQDLEQSDLGQVTGLIGGGLSGADGAVFMERGIYRIGYEGSPNIFAFPVAEGASGTQSPLSIVQRRLSTPAGTRGVAFYLGEDGFYAFDGANSLPIGAQKFDKAFFRDLDVTYVGAVHGIADPINKLIFWAYNAPGSGGLFNRAIVYNWDIGRGTLVDLSATPAETITRSLTIGYSLEGLDSVSSSIDALPFSLDSRVWTGGKPILSVFNSAHQLAYTTGSNLAPTVETSEAQLFPGRRATIQTARPLVDGSPASVSVGTREQLANSVVYQAAVPVNILGECPQRVTGRYVRFRLTLPAATNFGHLQGVDVTARPEGRRR